MKHWQVMIKAVNVFEIAAEDRKIALQAAKHELAERLRGLLVDKSVVKSREVAPPCPRCGNRLKVETNKNLKKEYPYVCRKCDENFYAVEVE